MTRPAVGLLLCGLLGGCCHQSRISKGEQVARAYVWMHREECKFDSYHPAGGTSVPVGYSMYLCGPEHMIINVTDVDGKPWDRESGVLGENQ